MGGVVLHLNHAKLRPVLVSFGGTIPLFSRRCFPVFYHRGTDVFLVVVLIHH
jgi:hypothetical protein